MGHIFFLCPPVVRGSLTLGWRGLCHSRGALPFFFNALDVHRGSGIPKASLGPTVRGSDTTLILLVFPDFAPFLV